MLGTEEPVCDDFLLSSDTLKLMELFHCEDNDTAHKNVKYKMICLQAVGKAELGAKMLSYPMIQILFVVETCYTRLR
jgi:hypothetical protein